MSLRGDAVGLIPQRQCHILLHEIFFEDNEYLSMIQKFLFNFESSARDWTEQSLVAMHLVFLRLESAIIN